MTIDDVSACVHEIFVNRDDDERAHGMEDELWEVVLKEIAAGAPNAADLAREVLQTKSVNFSRWCA